MSRPDRRQISWIVPTLWHLEDAGVALVLIQDASRELIRDVILNLKPTIFTPGDNVVSFLPLAHAFGCSFDFLAPMAAGDAVALSENPPCR